jgi:hypothetical protein
MFCVHVAALVIFWQRGLATLRETQSGAALLKKREDGIVLSVSLIFTVIFNL